jgi:hypothetical protein
VILFAQIGSPISRVPATGGQPTALSGLVRQGGDYSPHFLPDGRHFLYYVRGGPEARGVYVGDLEKTLDARRLLDSDSGAVYAPSGHVLFVRQETLFAQRFDPIRLELSGHPFAVAGHAVSVTTSGGSGWTASSPSVSTGGVIAYRTSSAAAARQFIWFDRSGKPLGQVGDAVTTALSMPSLSRDGERVALYRAVDGNADIWLLDAKRGGYSRFTTDPADDVMPVWSPNGDRIAFSSNRKGVHDLYQKSIANGGSEELLWSTAEHKQVTDWSADGRFLLVNSQNRERSGDIWALSLEAHAKPFPVVQTMSDELRGQFSPDVHWIAFQSNDSGRAEIYVQRFPGPATKWPVSVNGGKQVRWRLDGKELFYIALDGRLMAVPFHVAPNAQIPQVGAPFALFAPPLGGMFDERQQYMVSPDGTQFLVAAVSEEANSPITVILNWKPGR